MQRFLLAILLTFSTITVVAHGVLAFQFNAVQSLIPEEESHEDHPVKVKEAAKEKVNLSLAFSCPAHLLQVIDPASSFNFHFGKGYISTPYTPPDLG